MPIQIYLSQYYVYSKLDIYIYICDIIDGVSVKSSSSNLVNSNTTATGADPGFVLDGCQPLEWGSNLSYSKTKSENPVKL